MKKFAAVAVVALFALASGCSSDTDKNPSGTTSPTQSVPALTCLDVAPDMANAILAKTGSGAGLVAGKAVAVKALDAENVYLVAIEFTAPTADKQQVGVWAVGKSIELGAQGTILAVDGPAKKFTNWPDADKTDAEILPSDPNAAAAKNCLD